MSTFLRALDEAVRLLVFTKFQDDMGFTVENKDVLLQPAEVSKRMIAEKRGKMCLEFANVWRTRTGFDWDRNRSPLARRGVLLDCSPDNSNIVTAKTVPVNLEYDVWFWSLDWDKLNEVTETYLFWIHENPNLSISLDGVYPMDLDLHFGEVTDESPIEQQFNDGLYFVKRFGIKLDGWVFRDLFDTKTVKTITISVYQSCPPAAEDVLIGTIELILAEESGS